MNFAPGGSPSGRSAPGKVCRLAEKVETRRLSAVYAADARLSMECGPGMGPSVSTSVLMWISFMAQDGMQWEMSTKAAVEAPPSSRRQTAHTDMDTPDAARFPQPEWNDADSVEEALEALRTAQDDASALEAQDRFLWAVGNNHAGTFHPVVLATLPRLDQLLRGGNSWTQHAVLECLIDLAGSFVPAEGHAMHLGAPVQDTLQAFIQSLRPRIAELAEGSDVESGSARELLELIDDQLDLERLGARRGTGGVGTGNP